MAENREVKDEVMEQAAGGMIDEYSGNTATITAVFTANPHPDDPMFTDLWEECVQSNFRVYQIGKSGYAVAGPNMPASLTGRLFYRYKNHKEEKEMADERNMELNDEMMGQAVGGIIQRGEIGEPKYQMGQVVSLDFGKEENGESVITTLQGTIVGIKASPACWMYSVEMQANGRLYTITMPEFALDKDN